MSGRLRRWSAVTGSSAARSATWLDDLVGKYGDDNVLTHAQIWNPAARVATLRRPRVDLENCSSQLPGQQQ